jgi:hypothetical protein
MSLVYGQFVGFATRNLHAGVSRRPATAGRSDGHSGLEAGSTARSIPGSSPASWPRWSARRAEWVLNMATLIKTTQDGRKLEVIGLALCLDGKLEAFELIEVKQHPNCRAIWKVMPEATYMAGRVALTREQAEIVFNAFKEAEAQILANPAAINERFRITAMWKAREQGIE